MQLGGTTRETAVSEIETFKICHFFKVTPISQTLLLEQRAKNLDSKSRIAESKSPLAGLMAYG